MLRTLFKLLLPDEELHFRVERDILVVTFRARGRWHVQHAWTAKELELCKNDEVQLELFISKMYAARWRAQTQGLYSQEEINGPDEEDREGDPSGADGDSSSA
jgi:hypothetical protein